MALTSKASTRAHGMTIYPTHSCFNDALEYVEHLVETGWPIDEIRKLVIVHAIVLMPDGPEAGQQYAHAWVEDGPLVWQAGIYDGQRVYFSQLKDKYLPFMRVQEYTRYTLTEAYIANLESGHYGPWKPEYQALCRKNGES